MVPFLPATGLAFAVAQGTLRIHLLSELVAKVGPTERGHLFSHGAELKESD